MPQHIVCISDREEDIAFAKKVSAVGKLTFLHAPSAVVARKQLQEVGGSSVVLWDVDHPRAESRVDRLSVQSITQVLKTCMESERVFAISDIPLHSLPYLYGMTEFSHHLFRRYDGPASQIVSSLAMACFAKDRFGLSNYLPKDAAIREIRLKQSVHKRAAADALNNFLKKKGTPSQLCSQVAQATDEMLMNAIFDAPVDAEGNSYRKGVARSENFTLNQKEEVSLEIGLTPDYIAVSVTDNFGTFDKETVVEHMQRNYEYAPYEVSNKELGAGLGIYGMVQSGLSLLFISKPKLKTQVVLFFPVVRNFRAFRSSFRFVSFL